MCTLCDEGIPQRHPTSRRDFLKATAATGVAAAGLDLFAARPAAANDEDPPDDTGRRGRRYVIRGGCRDVDGSEGRRFPRGRRAGRGQEDRRRRAEPARRRRRR